MFEKVAQTVNLYVEKPSKENINNWSVIQLLHDCIRDQALYRISAIISHEAALLETALRRPN